MFTWEPISTDVEYTIHAVADSIDPEDVDDSNNEASKNADTVVYIVSDDPNFIPLPATPVVIASIGVAGVVACFRRRRTV